MCKNRIQFIWLWVALQPCQSDSCNSRCHNEVTRGGGVSVHRRHRLPGGAAKVRKVGIRYNRRIVLFHQFTIPPNSYKLYSLYVEDDEQAEELHNWYADGKLDFWSYGTLNDSVTVMVQPDLQEYFEAMLDDVQLESELVEENVQSLLEHEQEKRNLHILSKRRRPQKVPQKPNSTEGEVDEDAIDFEHFWTLDEIYRYMDRMERQYPNLVRVLKIGQTYENRSILALTVSRDGRINQTRPVVLVDAGVHAREWASHMSALYLINQLVESADKNEDLLYNTDWIIVPVANPDGYVYSYETVSLGWGLVRWGSS